MNMAGTTTDTATAPVATNDDRSDAIRRFYDGAAVRLTRDYVYGNARVSCQYRFFESVIQRDAERILIVGVGSGDCAHHIATRVAPQARITAVDISPDNVAISKKLFAHERIEYRMADILRDPIAGSWDHVLLPDVYEHISVDERSKLHRWIAESLAPNGRLLLTVPSPFHQGALARADKGLQPVDETVTVTDLLSLAADIGGTLTRFTYVSAFHTNDYMHALIERGADRYTLVSDDKSTMQETDGRNTAIRGFGAGLVRSLKLYKWSQYLRQRHVRKHLSLDASDIDADRYEF